MRLAAAPNFFYQFINCKKMKVRLLVVIG